MALYQKISWDSDLISNVDFFPVLNIIPGLKMLFKQKEMNKKGLQRNLSVLIDLYILCTTRLKSMCLLSNITKLLEISKIKYAYKII